MKERIVFFLKTLPFLVIALVVMSLVQFQVSLSSSMDQAFAEPTTPTIPEEGK
jgi:hypothetical protein